MDWKQIQRGLARRISGVVPLRWTTTATLATKEPNCWREFFPAETIAWPTTFPSGSVPAQFLERLTLAHEAKGVLRLRHAFVVSDDGWVFTRGGSRVLDLSQYGQLVEFAPRVRLPFPRWKARRLPGTTLSLLSVWGSCNFYHFLLDTLPKLELFRRLDVDWSAIDHILLPDFHSATADRLIALLKLPEEKIIRVGRGETFFVRADHLLCPSFPSGQRTVSRWAIEFLQRTRALPMTVGDRRFFVPRRGRNRLLRNEAELWRQLQAQGFESLDPGACDDAEAAFHSADVIVGVHGAALANLVFCRPGTRVLELLPSDQCHPHYLSLATQAGLCYDCIVGPSDQEKPRHPRADHTSPYDFTIDPDVFSQRLSRLLKN